MNSAPSPSSTACSSISSADHAGVDVPVAAPASGTRRGRSSPCPRGRSGRGRRRLHDSATARTGARITPSRVSAGQLAVSWSAAVTDQKRCPIGRAGRGPAARSPGRSPADGRPQPGGEHPLDDLGVDRLVEVVPDHPPLAQNLAELHVPQSCHAEPVGQSALASLVGEEPLLGGQAVVVAAEAAVGAQDAVAGHDRRDQVAGRRRCPPRARPSGCRPRRPARRS